MKTRQLEVGVYFVKTRNKLKNKSIKSLWDESITNKNTGIIFKLGDCKTA